MVRGKMELPRTWTFRVPAHYIRCLWDDARRTARTITGFVEAPVGLMPASKDLDIVAKLLQPDGGVHDQSLGSA